MNGRTIVIGIALITLVFGVAQWWFQTRAFYEPVELTELEIALDGGEAATLAVTGFSGIDANTSPLRFRGCFTVEDGQGDVIDRAAPYADPTPLVAPGWFECFDAVAIGTALETGEAQAYLSVHEVQAGADRVIALFPDGRGYAWHQLNGTLE